MSSYKHPLTLQVQELFTDSELTPDVTRLLLEELDEYFTSVTLDYSDNLPSVVNNLYAIGDHEMYSIISVCGFNSYEAVLIPPLQHLIKASSQKTIAFLRESGKYEKQTLHAEITKVIQLLKSVLELLRDSTLTTRRAIGSGVGVPTKEIDFPDYQTLKIFYECGRKVTYESDTEGIEKLFSCNSLYLCAYCNKYHQGRTSGPNPLPVSEEIILSRYKLAWRRYNKI
jgi:hypothetical protein